MTNHLLRRTAHVGAVLLLGSLLWGCGDDRDADPGAGAPSGSPGSSESGEPSQPSESPETANGAGALPASGDAFEAGQFTVNGPEGWRMRSVTPRTVRFSSGQPRNNAQLYKRPHGLVFVDVTDVSGEPALDALAEESVRAEPRLPDGTIDGEPAYHLANRDQAFETQEQLGLWRDGQQIRIDFSLIGGSKQQRQALVRSVLASWQWS